MLFKNAWGWARTAMKQCGMLLWYTLLFLIKISDIIIVGMFMLYLLGILCPVPWTYERLPVGLLMFDPYTPPAGWVPNNSCGEHGENVTRFEPVPYRVPKYAGPGANRRTWIGYLGSCTRDDDGRVFCTKPSISHPQWNLTYIQPNDVINASTLQKEINTKAAVAGAVTMGTIVIIFLWLSIPWHFWPHIPCTRFPWNRPMNILYCCVIFACAVASVATSVVSWSLSEKDLKRYMSADSFFEPAPCGTPRQLKQGVLMKVDDGSARNFITDTMEPFYCFLCLGLLVRLSKRALPKSAADDPEETSSAEQASISKSVEPLVRDV